MSTTRCFITGCVNDYSKRTHTPEVVHYVRPNRFHPLSEQVLEQWRNVIPPRRGKNDAIVPFDFDNAKHVLCELHFEDECLVKEDKFVIDGKTEFMSRERWALAPGAVPTNMLGEVKEEEKRIPRGRPPRLRKKRRILSEEKEEVDVATPVTPVLEEAPVSSKKLKYQYDLCTKDYYCSICLQEFRADLQFLKSVESKEAAYQQFVSLMGRYLGVDYQAAQKQFNREGHRGRLFSPVYRSVCEECQEAMGRICRLYGELELIKMKLNSELLRISQIFELEEWEGRGEELERKMGANKMNPVITVNRGIKSKRGNFLIPKLILKRVENSQAATEPSHPNADEEVEILEHTSKNTAAARAAGGGDLFPPGDDNGVICGSASFMNLLGLRNIEGCLACDKFFPSKSELQEHKMAYHTKRLNQPPPPSPPSPPSDEIPEPELDGGGSEEQDTPVLEPERKLTHYLARRPVPVSSSTKLPPDPSPAVTRPPTQPSSNLNPLDSQPSTSNRIASWVESAQMIEKTPSLVLNETLLERTDGNTGHQDDDDGDAGMISPCPSPAASSFHDDPDPTGDNDDDPADMKLGAEAADLKGVPVIPPTPDPPPPSEATTPLVEPKEEVEELIPSSTAAKKVPFMSSEYIGKYKIVCKLMNVKTGKTCVGVVAKTATATAGTLPNSTSSKVAVGDAVVVPRVISVEPELERSVGVVTKAVKTMKKKVRDTIQIPPIPGPPYKCPLEGCAKDFSFKKKCIQHYKYHKVRMDKVQKDIESGKGAAAVEALKEKRRKKRKRGRPKKNLDKSNEDEVEVEGQGSRSHSSKNGRGLGYHCDAKDCRSKFHKKEGLDYHRSMEHTPVQCHFCSQELPSISQLIRHEMSEHLQRNPEDFQENANEFCPRCQENVLPLVRQGFRHHYATVHFQLTPPKHKTNWPQCTDCNRQFFSLEKFERHVHLHHDNDQGILERELPHKCDQCQRRFRSEPFLRIHIKKVHDDGGPQEPRALPRAPCPIFHCHICGKVYTRDRHRFQTHLKLHAKNAAWNGRSNFPSGKAPSFSCEYCGRLFKREGTLWLHRRKIHEDPENERIECGTCGRLFLKEWQLTAHVRSKHQPKIRKIPAPRAPVACEMCGKAFPHRGLLRYHIRRVHPEVAHQFEVDPETGFVCEQCGKAYEDKASLARHQTKWCPGLQKEAS